MSKKVRIICFVVVAVLAIMLVGCNKTEAPVESSEAPVESSEAPVESSEAPVESSEAPVESSAATGEGVPEGAPFGAQPDRDLEGMKLATCVMTAADEYMTMVLEGSEAFAERNNCEVSLLDGEMSPEKQVQKVESAMSAGVQAIEIRVVDAASMVDTLAEAKTQGIYTAVYPTDATGADIYLIYDDYSQGEDLAKECANWIIEKYDGKAEIGMLTMPENAQVMSRAEAFYDVFAEMIPESEIVAEGAAIVAEDGMSQAESFLQAHPDMKAIICVNDGGGVGAAEAAKMAGKTKDDFWIGGVNGDQVAIEAIQEGDSPFQCTIATNLLPPESSYIMLTQLANAVLGEKYEDIVVQNVVLTQDTVDAHLAKTPFYESMPRYGE